MNNLTYCHVRFFLEIILCIFYLEFKMVLCDFNKVINILDS